MITSIDDIFGDIPVIDLSKAICHSGGALGSDLKFESELSKYGGNTRAYSYQTEYHNSPNKVEISEEDFQEGIDKVNKANHTLNRYGIHKYMNLLARNWCQIKYSEQIFAVGYIIPPGKKGKKGYYNRSKYEVVDGGTSYAVQMAIDHDKEVYVFDQNRKGWYHWSSSTMSFINCKNHPVITRYNFTGIGSRELTEEGKEAIEKLLLETHNKFK